MRACSPTRLSSAPGTRMRAHISSSSMRGAVAPRKSIRAALTMSAVRASSAGPNPEAWADSGATRSPGTSMSPWAAASGTTEMTMRSRNRCRRSSAKRRGSWPDSMILSMTPKTVAPSRAAIASATSSSRESGV